MVTDSHVENAPCADVGYNLEKTTFKVVFTDEN